MTGFLLDAAVGFLDVLLAFPFGWLVLTPSYTLNNAQLTDVMSCISPCNGCFGITSVLTIEGVTGNPKYLYSNAAGSFLSSQLQWH